MRPISTGHSVEVEMYFCYFVGNVNQRAKVDEDFKPNKKYASDTVFDSDYNKLFMKLSKEEIQLLVNYFWNWFEWP